MTFKSFLVAAALTVATATSASAAIFTATVSGTVSYIQSNNGYFSDIDTGDAFTYTMSFDMDGASTNGQQDVNYYYGNTYSYLNINSPSLLGAQLKVNGKSVNTMQPMTSAYAGMSDYSRIGYQDYMNVQSYGNNYTGYSNTWTNMSAYVNAYNMTGTVLDFGREYTHTVGAGDNANFYASTGYWDNYGNNYYNASMSGTIDTISFNAANDVPEPAGVALMALGLIAIGAVRRRKAARA